MRGFILFFLFTTTCSLWAQDSLSPEELAGFPTRYVITKTKQGEIKYDKLQIYSQEGEDLKLHYGDYCLYIKNYSNRQYRSFDRRYKSVYDNFGLVINEADLQKKNGGKCDEIPWRKAKVTDGISRSISDKVKKYGKLSQQQLQESLKATSFYTTATPYHEICDEVKSLTKLIQELEEKNIAKASFDTFKVRSMPVPFGAPITDVKKLPYYKSNAKIEFYDFDPQEYVEETNAPTAQALAAAYIAKKGKKPNAKYLKYLTKFKGAFKWLGRAAAIEFVLGELIIGLFASGTDLHEFDKLIEENPALIIAATTTKQKKEVCRRILYYPPALKATYELLSELSYLKFIMDEDSSSTVQEGTVTEDRSSIAEKEKAHSSSSSTGNSVQKNK